MTNLTTSVVYFLMRTQDSRIGYLSDGQDRSAAEVSLDGLHRACEHVAIAQGHVTIDSDGTPIYEVEAILDARVDMHEAYWSTSFDGLDSTNPPGNPATKQLEPFTTTTLASGSCYDESNHGLECAR